MLKRARPRAKAQRSGTPHTAIAIAAAAMQSNFIIADDALGQPLPQYLTLTDQKTCAPPFPTWRLLQQADAPKSNGSTKKPLTIADQGLYLAEAVRFELTEGSHPRRF